ncbi:MAG: type I secretion system permease/ATPase [Alphaproteobacteria bacterium]|nr:type I secretion system permease/ATPase [Alphaproteobacteria bacterium]
MSSPLRLARASRPGQPAKSELYLALEASRGALVVTAVFSFFINLLMLVSPLYMLQVYDRVLSSRSESTLLYLTIIAVLLLGLMGLLELIRSRVLVRTSVAFDNRLRDRVFSAMFHASIANPEAKMPQALRDLITVRQFLTGSGLFALLDAPWVPIFIAVTFIFHPLLGWVSVSGAIILFFLAFLSEYMTRKPLQEANTEAIRASNFVESTLRNGEVLAAMGMVGAMRERWARRQDTVIYKQATASDFAGLITSMTKFFRILIQTVILGVGAYLALLNEITAGVMVAASIIMGRALAPVEMAVGQWQGFIAARTAYNRVANLLDMMPAEKERMSLPKPTGSVVVDRVVALPPGSTNPALKGVSFALEPGESLGVIGPSAAGKSTLARLLVGVWPLFQGSVRLDGADIAKWSRDELGPHIGYLPQDVELFEGTIAENIARFGKIDPDAVVEAANRAGVHDLVLHLPEGYDSAIGEGGRMLSGGQRQRVALARALYGDPIVVVLDEPNSNLDADGESALVNALATLKKLNKTVIIIAHRPSILATIDKILVLNAGVVVAFGPRDQVMNQYTRPAVVPTPSAAGVPFGVAPGGSIGPDPGKFTTPGHGG